MLWGVIIRTWVIFICLESDDSSGEGSDTEWDGDEDDDDDVEADDMDDVQGVADQGHY
jgi:hypothetical protein